MTTLAKNGTGLLVDKVAQTQPEGVHRPLKGFKITPTGLQPIGRPSYETWLEAGETLFYLYGSLRFAVGDWILYGEGAFKEKMAQANALTLFAVHTLQNSVWVASRIPQERRRERPFSFSHHEAVAALQGAAQEQLLKWCVLLDAEGNPTGKIRGRDELREAVALYKHNQERLERGENLDDPEPVLELPAGGKLDQPFSSVTVTVKALRGVAELNEQMADLDDAELIRLDLWKG